MANHEPRILLVALAMSCAAAVDAEALTPEQAWARAQQTHMLKTKTAHPAAGFKPVYTTEAGGLATSYVFDTGDDGGFVVLSADDLTVPVLGYSDAGSFDPTDIPPALAVKLDRYSRQIQRARERQGDVAVPGDGLERPAIEPLVHTTWGQDYPYNMYCPRDTAGNRSVTGCVATAIAQMMKCHNHPAVGVGTHQYDFDLDRETRTLSIDFAEHPFDWGHMLDDYQVAPMTPKIAVADLMYCVGVSVDMMYSPEGSGTYDSKAQRALVNHFDYDQGVRKLLHFYYSSSEWASIVYNELREGRPLYYSGGGHAFVCDGYADGYFHMNWGWSGYFDGYYLLDALDVLGDGSLVFNDFETILTGVRPSEPTSVRAGDFHSICDFFVKANSKKLGKRVYITSREHAEDADDYWYCNDCTTPYCGTFGINVISADGRVVYVAGDKKNIKYVEYSDPVYPDVSSYTVAIPEDLAEGVYTIVPACCPDGGEPSNIDVYRDYVQAYRMEVRGGYAYFEPVMPEVYSELTLEHGMAASLGGDAPRAQMDVSLSNASDQSRRLDIAAGLYPLGSKEYSVPVFAGEPMSVEVPAGGETAVSYGASFAGAPAGRYMLYFYDATTLKRLSSGRYVEIDGQSAPDGVAAIDAERSTLSIEYYDLQGRPLANPVAGGMYIQRRTYTDGSTTTAKVAM